MLESVKLCLGLLVTRPFDIWIKIEEIPISAYDKLRFTLHHLPCLLKLIIICRNSTIGVSNSDVVWTEAQSGWLGLPIQTQRH